MSLYFKKRNDVVKYSRTLRTRSDGKCDKSSVERPVIVPPEDGEMERKLPDEFESDKRYSEIFKKHAESIQPLVDSLQLKESHMRVNWSRKTKGQQKKTMTKIKDKNENDCFNKHELSIADLNRISYRNCYDNAFGAAESTLSQTTRTNRSKTSRCEDYTIESEEVERCTRDVSVDVTHVRDVLNNGSYGSTVQTNSVDTDPEVETDEPDQDDIFYEYESSFVTPDLDKSYIDEVTPQESLSGIVMQNLYVSGVALPVNDVCPFIEDFIDGEHDECYEEDLIGGDSFICLDSGSIYCLGKKLVCDIDIEDNIRGDSHKDSTNQETDSEMYAVDSGLVIEGSNNSTLSRHVSSLTSLQKDLENLIKDSKEFSEMGRNSQIKQSLTLVKKTFEHAIQHSLLFGNVYECLNVLDNQPDINAFRLCEKVHKFNDVFVSEAIELCKFTKSAIAAYVQTSDGYNISAQSSPLVLFEKNDVKTKRKRRNRRSSLVQYELSSSDDSFGTKNPEKKQKINYVSEKNTTKPNLDIPTRKESSFEDDNLPDLETGTSVENLLAGNCDLNSNENNNIQTVERRMENTMKEIPVHPTNSLSTVKEDVVDLKQSKGDNDNYLTNVSLYTKGERDNQKLKSQKKKRTGYMESLGFAVQLTPLSLCKSNENFKIDAESSKLRTINASTTRPSGNPVLAPLRHLLPPQHSLSDLKDKKETLQSKNGSLLSEEKLIRPLMDTNKTLSRESTLLSSNAEIRPACAVTTSIQSKILAVKPTIKYTELPLKNVKVSVAQCNVGPTTIAPISSKQSFKDTIKSMKLSTDLTKPTKLCKSTTTRTLEPQVNIYRDDRDIVLHVCDTADVCPNRFVGYKQSKPKKLLFKESVQSPKTTSTTRPARVSFSADITRPPRASVSADITRQPEASFSVDNALQNTKTFNGPQAPAIYKSVGNTSLRENRIDIEKIENTLSNCALYSTFSNGYGNIPHTHVEVRRPPFVPRPPIVPRPTLVTIVSPTLKSQVAISKDHVDVETVPMTFFSRDKTVSDFCAVAKVDDNGVFQPKPGLPTLLLPSKLPFQVIYKKDFPTVKCAEAVFEQRNPTPEREYSKINDTTLKISSCTSSETSKNVSQTSGFSDSTTPRGKSSTKASVNNVQHSKPEVQTDLVQSCWKNALSNTVFPSDSSTTFQKHTARSARACSDACTTLHLDCVKHSNDGYSRSSCSNISILSTKMSRLEKTYNTNLITTPTKFIRASINPCQSAITKPKTTKMPIIKETILGGKNKRKEKYEKAQSLGVGKFVVVAVDTPRKTEKLLFSNQSVHKQNQVVMKSEENCDELLQIDTIKHRREYPMYVIRDVSSESIPASTRSSSLSTTTDEAGSESSSDNPSSPCKTISVSSSGSSETTSKSSSAPNETTPKSSSSTSETTTKSSSSTNEATTKSSSSPSQTTLDRRTPGIRPFSVDSNLTKGKSRGFLYYKECQQILEEITLHPHSAQFRFEPKARFLPDDYFKVVQRPMWLIWIRCKLKEGRYVSLWQFVHDIKRVFWNCRLYNHPGHKLMNSCKSLEKFLNQKLDEYFPNLDFTNILGNPGEGGADWDVRRSRLRRSRRIHDMNV